MGITSVEGITSGEEGLGEVGGIVWSDSMRMEGLGNLFIYKGWG